MASSRSAAYADMRDSRNPSRTPSSRSCSPQPPSPQPRPWVKKQPQKSIDEFWEKFTTKSPGKPFTILPDNLYAKRLAAARRNHPVDNSKAFSSYEEAKQLCKEKVEKIVKECKRINQKYRDVHFDIESDFSTDARDCLSGLDDDVESTLQPGGVKRIEDIFEEPQFYIDGPTANDVRQGKDGDCWFMSALCTLSNMKPVNLIEKVCVARDEKVGVYGFVFYRDGEWISEVIDDKLYLIKPDFDGDFTEQMAWLDIANRKNPAEEYRRVMQTGSRALYFAQCSDQDETWLPLLEKAYAKAHGDYLAIEGGWVGEAIEDLTGGVTTEVFATDILDKDKFWEEEIMQVNQKFLFGCGQLGGVMGDRQGVFERHAYSIMDATEIDKLDKNGKPELGKDGEPKRIRLVKLRNPWGKTEWKGPWSDGSEEWTPERMKELAHRFGDDGVFWMDYKDMLRVYQHFDRTRIFEAEKWKITQQWTSLNIPWSVDYHDTKFTLTISEAGHFVIVLSQLDDRYFRGLEGQYQFKLQFRLHRENEMDYIVRSPASYYMKRSVSTEVDLEAGTYSILLKITANRNQDKKAVEQVVRDTCRWRREKLLQIGLSYDLAHAKGQFKETEKEKQERQKEERREKRREEAKKRHDARRLEKRKQKLRERRKEDKIRGKLQDRIESDTPRSTNAQSTDGVSDNDVQSGPASAGAADEAPQHTDQTSGVRRPLPISALSQNGPPTPGLQINGRPLPARSLSLKDISDDELSFDSDLDAPPDSDDDEEQATRYVDMPPGMNPQARRDQEDDDDFASDPWNAVCVVGLRVYYEKGDVTVAAVKPEKHDATIHKEKKLDLDDSAADATKNISGCALEEGEEVDVVGSSPDAVEDNKQG